MSAPQLIEPGSLAELVRPLVARALLAFDVDGVLAPIVRHADRSRLTPGVDQTLVDLAERSAVAIVSGRSLESLERLFAFPESLHVIGSHGLELRGVEPRALDHEEQYTFDQLEIIAARGVAAAGEGAWLERKPASVVLHIREADDELARPVVEAVTRLASTIAGAQVTPGSAVVELLARPASKGSAILALAQRLDRAPIVYLGDDVTDEDAFRVMSAHDVSVRVGPGNSAARYRLSGPDAVATFLTELAQPIS